MIHIQNPHLILNNTQLLPQICLELEEHEAFSEVLVL